MRIWQSNSSLVKLLMVLNVPSENLEMELDYSQLLTRTYPRTLNAVSLVLCKLSQHRGTAVLTYVDSAAETGVQGYQPAAEADQKWR